MRPLALRTSTLFVIGQHLLIPWLLWSYSPSQYVLSMSVLLWLGSIFHDTRHVHDLFFPIQYVLLLPQLVFLILFIGFQLVAMQVFPCVQPPYASFHEASQPLARPIFSSILLPSLKVLQFFSSWPRLQLLASTFWGPHQPPFSILAHGAFFQLQLYALLLFRLEASYWPHFLLLSNSS